MLNEKLVSGAWVNIEQYTFTYDSNGHVLTQLRLKWESGTWKNYSKSMYTYSGNENLLIDVYEDLWIDNDWTSANKYYYTYDSNQNLLTKTYEKWQSNQGEFVLVYMYTYTYDGSNNMLTKLYAKWINETMVNDYRYTWTYDGHTNSITGKYEKFQGINSWQAGVSSIDVLSYQNTVLTLSKAYRFDASFWSVTQGIASIEEIGRASCRERV